MTVEFRYSMLEDLRTEMDWVGYPTLEVQAEETGLISLKVYGQEGKTLIVRITDDGYTIVPPEGDPLPEKRYLGRVRRDIQDHLGPGEPDSGRHIPAPPIGDVSKYLD
jgi:hypothetical protein